MTNEIEKLRAKELQIKKRIREIQSRSKSADRKQRSARLIRWGVVVEGMIKAGEIETNDWVDACKHHLKNVRDIEIATAEILSSLPNEAHFCVSPAEKHCAPAAGKNQSVAE